ncbi:hypothetical protein [Halomonas sp. C05BenzN]|uniref:hypothetical protein n=1 Tax=Halomonas sp. C05BenzN TaxID=3411041 RepID=UPI003B9549A4
MAVSFAIEVEATDYDARDARRQPRRLFAGHNDVLDQADHRASPRGSRPELPYSCRRVELTLAT